MLWAPAMFVIDHPSQHIFLFQSKNTPMNQSGLWILRTRGHLRNCQMLIPQTAYGSVLTINTTWYIFRFSDVFLFFIVGRPILFFIMSITRIYFLSLISNNRQGTPTARFILLFCMKFKLFLPYEYGCCLDYLSY